MKRLHSERPSTSREENSVGKRVRTCEPSINNQNFVFISESLSSDEWPLLGRKLGLNTVVLKDLEKNANIHIHGREETIIRMLEKWQQRVNLSDEERVLKLKTALIEIGLNDIATKIQEEVDYAELLKKIQGELKKRFKDITLPTSVWLDKKILPLEDLFVELTMKNYCKQGGEEQKDINKEEIFLETAKGIPRRILVEGQPGYGKTTLVAKFLTDWARKEKYLTDRFDLVFVIPLRIYTGKKLSYYLLQHCERVKTSEEHKMGVIESIKERVLLLLDGLDEIPSDVKENISPLIMGDEYPELTVVVTCRVGFLKLEPKSNDIFQAMKIRNLETESVWDKRVKIEGVSHNKRKEFLQKYLKVNDQILREQLSKTNLEVNDLYECPLFLLLLAVLMQEKDIHQIKTKTELYKTIFNFVINRGLERLIGKRKEVDVFDLKCESDVFGYRNFLINFGRLCIQKIKKRSLLFEKSELLKCSNGKIDDEDLIFKLGFLSKQVIFFNYEEKELYEPIHRSFLEFSAAFYLSLSDEMETEIQELVLTYDIWPQDDQLLYPFLGGMLHSNTFKMFNAFSTFKEVITIFSNYKYDVRKVLLEIPETEENLKSLENLAIGNWDDVKYEESLHFWFDGLMKNRGEEIDLHIPEHLDIINRVSDDIKVNLIVVTSYGGMKKEDMIKEKNIHCQNLIINLKGHDENIPKILKEMSMIKAEKVWLKINFYSGICDPIFDLFLDKLKENVKMTVDEKLMERFPEELVEGVDSDVPEDLYNELCADFYENMEEILYEDLKKDDFYVFDVKGREPDEFLGDDIMEKILEEFGEKLNEKFGEKLNEISRDMLEDELFEKFQKQLNYIYNKIGQEYWRFFGLESSDLLNVNLCEILSENLCESEGSLLNHWYFTKMKDVLDEVVKDKVELDEVVFDEDVEIDRKYNLLGEEICIGLGMKKRIVDTLSENIFCLITNEIVEKFHEELIHRIDEEIFVGIKEFWDKTVKCLNERELLFNIYHLSLLDVKHYIFRIFVPLIQDLIQKKKIEHEIKIEFNERNINDSFIDYYNSFVEIVSNSHLKSFRVDSSFLDDPLPFPITLFNNEKQMEFIGLKGSFKGINVDEMKSVSVDHFDCVRLRLGEKNLLPKLISTFRNMKKLTCDCDLINDLGINDSISEWKQLQTIDQLEIVIEIKKMENKESFLKGISLFHNVRELGLVTRIRNERKFTFGFVARLPSLKKIRYYGWYYPHEFFKKLLDLKFEEGKRELRLDAVEFQLNHYKLNISEKDIEDIELCFQKNVFHKFSIINVWRNNSGNVLKHFISKREFKVYSQWKEIRFVDCDATHSWKDYTKEKVLRKHLNICVANVK